jgi:SAM-dependent methyltransferase
VSEPAGAQQRITEVVNSDPRARRSGFAGVVNSLLRRSERPVRARQREIDHAIVHWLGQLETALQDLRAEQHRQNETLAALRAWLTATSARGDEVAGRLEANIADNARSIAELTGRTAADVTLTGSGMELETFDAGPAGTVVGFRTGGADQGDGVYVGFEGFFRGSEDTIRERQRVYLPLLEGRAPVLDVGCGRGELLELLAGAGVEAMGIDTDPAMVQRCRAKGLTRVEVGDGAGYLERLDAGSIGAVFAAQVIEHLPYDDLLRFLRACHRALKPGGIVIMETVNPHAPQALKQFWIDPTHQHPLFPEIVLALCRLTGYASGYIWHPQGSGDPDRDRGQQPDYAVVAERAALS